MSRSATRVHPQSEQTPTTNALHIGDPNSAFEREADRFADELMSGEMPKRNWSLTQVGFGQTLQRKCGCGGSSDSKSECDDCKEKKLLQRKPSGHSAPNVAPPIVHNVLNSTGRPLDRATRSFFEPRLGIDLGNVQVYDDSRAAKSAAAVNAHAYTVGNSIVFGPGRYRPNSTEGRRLLAHELTHVAHQRGATDRLVQREDNPEIEVVDAPKTNSLLDRAFDAADAAHWQEAAELANGLNSSDLKAFMGSLGGGGWKLEQLHIGAINNPRLGPNSAVAKMTRWSYLNAKFNEQMKGGFYQAASEYLNGFSASEIRARVTKMKTEVVAGLHNGAIAQAGVGPGSNAATITAEELDKRKEKGDAAADAATKPVAVEGPAEKKKRCQDTGGKGFKIFPLRLPKGMWQMSNAPITAERKGDEIQVKQPFNEVKGDSMFRGETKTLPMETFLGGIRLKKDDVVGVRLYDDNKRLACVTGEEMLKFSDATDMAILFSIGRTAIDAATIFAPGASAGVGKAMGVGAGYIVAGQALEVGRQEMMVSYGLQDEVDWGGIAFDTAFQLATLGFSKYLNSAATKAVLGKAPELGQKPIQLIIQSVIQGGTAVFQTAARTAFDLLRNQKKKFVPQEFLEQLATQFTMGALFAFVAGAAHHDEGLPQQKKGGAGQQEQAPPPPVHDETPTPAAQSQKKAVEQKTVAPPVHDETPTPAPLSQKKAAEQKTAVPPVHDETPTPAAQAQKKAAEQKTAAPPVHDETPTPAAQSQKKAAATKVEEHAGTPGVEKKTAAKPDEHAGTADAAKKKADEKHAPSVEEGTAVDKKDALAQEKTKDGHDVVVTDKGVGKCSPPPCPVIHIEYAEELKDRPKLQEAYAEIERLRALGTKSAARKAASYSKQLVDVLEGIRAENKLTPGRKNVPATGHPDELAEPIMDTSELMDQPEVRDRKPVDIRLQEARAGNKYDDIAGKKYPANEIPMYDKGGVKRRLDSYDPAKGEIVSRKSLVTANGQIAFMDEFKMIEYFQEFALKYQNGVVIANTPASRKMIVNGQPLAGQRLKGRYVLEVPPQEYPIPARVKEEAAKRGITIRDDQGKVY